ncbi:uncharacterized protein [Delphinus delphis]|uniref:uncharacterized protein n=1 Tax=Delphinus delphis TaxID=9728 RepID=UPI0028C4A084|nr:uncharacterized protein LOC132416937 [Delphinus delphis]
MIKEHRQTGGRGCERSEGGQEGADVSRPARHPSGAAMVYPRTAPRPGPAPAAPYHHPEFFRLQRTPRFSARYRLACYHVVSSRCCIAFRAVDGSSCCHFLAESSGTGSPDHAQEGWARGTRGSASLLRRGGRLSRPEHPGPGSPGLAVSARTLVPDLCIDLAGSSANLIPRVTAIRTSPDLQWLVRPTEVFLAAPSHKIPPPIRSSSGLDGGYPMKTMAGGRTQGVGRKGKMEQVRSRWSPSLCREGWGDSIGGDGEHVDRMRPLMEFTTHPELATLAQSPFHPKSDSDSSTPRNSLIVYSLVGSYHACRLGSPFTC